LLIRIYVGSLGSEDKGCNIHLRSIGVLNSFFSALTP